MMPGRAVQSARLGSEGWLEVLVVFAHGWPRSTTRARTSAGGVPGYQSFCTPSQHAAAGEEVARIEAAFDELADDHREVLLQLRLLGVSRSDYAARTDRSEETVSSLLYRALGRLNAILERAEGGRGQRTTGLRTTTEGDRPFGRRHA